MFNKINICVIGMGYVGLPLANAMSKYFKLMDMILIKKKLKT